MDVNCLGKAGNREEDYEEIGKKAPTQHKTKCIIAPDRNR